MKHRCHATGCEIAVPPSMFMCRNHWYSLPKPMRDAIWSTYRAGQETDKRPSDDYLFNARQAIAFIEQRDAQNGGVGPAGTVMPAITIWQPWAELIAAEAKPFEFRSLPAPKGHQGKRIAIHAGARRAPIDEIRDLVLTLQSSFWRDTGLDRDKALPILNRLLITPDRLPRGVIVCTAMLGTPIRNAEMERAIGLTPLNDSDRTQHSNWGWPLTDVQRLDPPHPARGAQGFWQVSVPATGDAPSVSPGEHNARLT